MTNRLWLELGLENACVMTSSFSRRPVKSLFADLGIRQCLLIDMVRATDMAI